MGNFLTELRELGTLKGLGCDSNFRNDTALALDVQARTLVATINRYRLSLVDPDDSDF
jgi:hypothetical protein